MSTHELREYIQHIERDKVDDETTTKIEEDREMAEDVKKNMFYLFGIKRENHEWSWSSKFSFPQSSLI